MNFLNNSNPSKNYIKLTLFKDLKLYKCNQIKEEFQKDISICDQLSKNLMKLGSNNDFGFNEESILAKKKNNNKSNILEKKKLLHKNNDMISFNKKKVMLKKNNSFYSKTPSICCLKKKDCNGMFNRSIYNLGCLGQKTKINLKPIKKKILNRDVSVSKSISFDKDYSSIVKNSNIGIDECNCSLVNNDSPNESRYKSKTFITIQKPGKIINKNIKNKTSRSFKSVKNIHSTKNILKRISNKQLTNIIKSSSTLYNNEFNKLNHDKDFLSAKRHYYNIKYLINKFGMKKTVENQVEDYEAMDINNIYLSIINFRNDLKGKVYYSKKDVTKHIMITKKNADIINYGDYYSKMDNLHYYKNNKIYKRQYPSLKIMENNELMIKDYNNIINHSHKNSLEGNNNQMRQLINKCNKNIQKIIKKYNNKN